MITFYDFMLKYNHKLDDKNDLQAVAYYSDDRFSITSDSLFGYTNRLISYVPVTVDNLSKTLEVFYVIENLFCTAFVFCKHNCILVFFKISLWQIFIFQLLISPLL